MNVHQRSEALQEKPVKKESTLDLLTMMSDRVAIKFHIGNGQSVSEVGRWCFSWEKEKEKETPAKNRQQQLNFEVVTGPREFTRSGTLQAVTTLITSNNQVSFNMIYHYHKMTHL